MVLLILTQPTVSEFPPEGTELGEGAIPLPGVCWAAMQPHGSGRLLSLPLWLSLQYLGEWGRQSGSDLSGVTPLICCGLLQGARL